MILKRYWNETCIAIIAGMAALTFACILPLYNADTNTSYRAIVFMSSIYAGMVLCLILFISVFADQRINEATFYFMCLISFEFLSLFMEFMHWHLVSYGVKGIPRDIIYHSEILVLTAIIYLFGNYEKCILKLEDEKYSRLHRSLDLFLVIEIAILLLNVATGLFFRVNDGVFENGPLYPLLFLPPMVMVIICTYIALKYSQQTRHKIILVLYLALPVAAIILKLPSFSSSLTALAALVSFIIMYGEVYLDRGIRIVKNEAIMTEQKIALMISRIEPDFLSESLQSIADMEGAPIETKTAIENFARYLEENVDKITVKTPITFEEELEHVKTYIALEKLRFKSKLDVIFDIRDRDFKLPPMTLQMIVENAIKHGVTQREEGGHVRIITEELSDCHRITVTDDGVGFDMNSPNTENVSHVGLESVSKRLDTMIGGRLDISSKKDVGTTATIIIPKIE